MESRINYFDVIKTICIFLVVYVHYPWISNSSASNISMIVTIVAVPLFFMVNGALLLNKKLNLKKHYDKIKLFFISLILLKLLILVICIITQRINISNYKIESIFFYLFSENNLINVPAEHLWFMYTLLKIYLLYPLIYYMFQNNKNSLKYILLFCLIFSFGVEGLNDLSLILNKFFKFPIINFNSLISSYSPILYILNYLSYFILGYYLHNTFSNKDISRKKVFLLIIIYFIGLGLIFLSRYIQTGYLFDGQYQRIQNDYSKIGNLIMCYSLFILISKIKIKNYKFFNYIGSRTLNIYYVHMTILAYAFTYLLPYFIKYCGTKLNVIRTIVTIILSIIITEILKKIPIVKKIFS